MNRVVTIVVLLLILFGGFYWYKHHNVSLQAENGEIHCDGCLSPAEHEKFLKENSGEDADGQSERKSTRGNVSADSAPKAVAPVAATTPATTAPASTANATTPVAPVAQTATAVQPTPAPVAAPASAPSNVSSKSVRADAPASDTIAPNPPNGAVYTGSGAYQWYRQGNLTWRVNSRTGRSCIIYATPEEWLKDIVYSHGCGGNA